MRATIEFGIHVCPQCEKDIASGINAMTGRPQICAKCIERNVRLKFLARNVSARVFDDEMDAASEGHAEMSAGEKKFVWCAIAALAAVIVWLAMGAM